LQFDFAGGQGVLKDAYITITKIPGVGNFQVGHFKEPIGMELLTSSKYITMMERSLTDPLTPERNTGAMLFNNQFNKRMVWALGYFLPSDNFGTYVGDKYHISGRIAGTPIYDAGKENSTYKVLHLGVSLTHQYQSNSKYVLKSRPESHLIDPIVVAEIDKAKAVNQIGGEAALVFGPVSLQSEYIHTNAITAEGSILQNDNYQFSAFYATVSWFITGEHKKYNTTESVFDRVKPNKNFGSEKGVGAWEIALRYSDLDLDDTDIQGGKLANITAGLNWYLNPSTRIMFNYVIANLKGVGNINIFQMRFQVDF
jgi:phosphate-selective porin OprO/OprP